MASIKQITVGGTTYDIKATYDGSGNTIASYYVKKSGDTMTGTLTVSGSFTASAPAAGSVLLKANTVNIRNAKADNNQAGTKPYITELDIGDGRYVRFTEYNDDDLEIRGSTILLNANGSADPPAYSNTATYASGVVVWYNQRYYTANQAIETAEEWNSAHWNQWPMHTGITVSGNMIPIANNTYDLGGSSYKWKNLYTTTVSATTVNASSVSSTTIYGGTITTTSGGAAFRCRNISFGTSAPSGGSNGDIYIQYT